MAARMFYLAADDYKVRVLYGQPHASAAYHYSVRYTPIDMAGTAWDSSAMEAPRVGQPLSVPTIWVAMRFCFMPVAPPSVLEGGDFSMYVQMY
jgi:hypothetical protein